MCCVLVSQSGTCSPVACVRCVRRLPVTFPTYIILGSYNAQADIGDFDPTRHAVPNYLRGMPFAPQNLQTGDMVGEIAGLHAQHQGVEPERADYIYLDNARRLALYGLHLYDCKARAPLPSPLAFRTSGQLSTRPGSCARFPCRSRPLFAPSRVPAPTVLPRVFCSMCAHQCSAGAKTRVQCALTCVRTTLVASALHSRLISQAFEPYSIGKSRAPQPVPVPRELSQSLL